MRTPADRVPLGARAWLGDGRGGALVSADGTLDWYCPGPLAGDPVCSALLDPAGGAVRVGPARPGGGARRLPPWQRSYRDGTMVTDLVLDAGGRRVRVTDFLPWEGPSVTPPGRLVRIVTALSGPVEVEVDARPGGWGPPRRVVAGGDGLVADRVLVRAGTPLAPTGRGDVSWRGTRRLDTGERMVVTVDRLDDERHSPLSPDAALRAMEATEVAWRSWLAPLRYAGPYRHAVERSLLALRSLAPAEGGPPLAAGTTSLPRRPGGERNADGRCVRWRDAATASSVLGRLGFDDDALAAETWLRRAAEGSPLPWPAALAAGTGALPERRELPLAGWRRSQPVVTGRADPADRDLLGSVALAVSASTVLSQGGAEDWGGPVPDLRAGAPGGRLAGPLTGAWPALVAAADHLAEHWAEPDGGVWGLGGPPRRLTATRVQAWVALDRLARLARAANPLDLDAVGWQQAAVAARQALERSSLAADGGLGLEPGSEQPDAALLRVAWAGPWPPGHPIVTATVARVLERLGTGALLHRYPTDLDDGLAGADAPDLEASLWAVRALAALGRWEEAHERMERICALAGAGGVLAEAADPLSGELLGNLPAAGAHLALLDAALALEAGPR